MPDTVLAPYDRSLKDEPPAYRTRWSEDVGSGVIEHCRALGLNTVEVRPNGLGTGRPQPVTLILTNHPITGPVFFETLRLMIPLPPRL